ncbi:MAG: hypothetical protein HYY76_03970 [Acidobacteria bacterium]|nr:hypothetical protein [Acidobacteriota bacterium]
MKLAWFRPAALAPTPKLDATAALIAGLQATHALELFTDTSAHDFVWKHFRAPYELCVFELDNTAAHAFIWPYLLHYPGVLLLASPTLHDSRAQALIAAGRRGDYEQEFAFNEGYAARRLRVPPRVPHGSWAMLRAPLLASRLAVVPHRSVAELLCAEHPAARVAYAPLPVPEVDLGPRENAGRAGVTFGVLAGDRIEVARRAHARAVESGAEAELVIEPSPDRLLDSADVVLALSWPAPGDPLQLARAAMAARKPVVAPETVFTADWPALDPQTWRPRGSLPDAPAAVTIDLRDEEHSLALAMRRLSADAPLRARLADEGQAWWRAHASPRRALERWERLLREAATLDPPARPADWPPHLTPDGTERTRAMLEEFGVTVDLFD